MSKGPLDNMNVASPAGTRSQSQWRKICTLVVALLAVASARPAATAPAESGTIARRASARDTSDIDALVDGIDRRYHDVWTLKTEFTQTYVWGDTTRKERGTAYFARGGLMRWEYREPRDKLVVADGKRMWLYIPQEKQVTQSAFNPEDDPRVPFPLLLSHFNLHKVFSKIEFADQALKAAPGDRVLRGYARHGYEDLYSQVLIEVTPTLDVKRLVVFYPDRSAMEFAFENMEKNLPLTRTLFAFTPPPGSEVIKQ
jgi:outer membrane lipoprotein carrier protein